MLSARLQTQGPEQISQFFSPICLRRGVTSTRVHAGILDEKAAATQALGLYAKATLELYGPYVERTLATLQRMSSYFHDDVREQAYDSLAYLTAATSKAYPFPTPGKTH